MRVIVLGFLLLWGNYAFKQILYAQESEGFFKENFLGRFGYRGSIELYKELAVPANFFLSRCGGSTTIEMIVAPQLRLGSFRSY